MEANVPQGPRKAVHGMIQEFRNGYILNHQLPSLTGLFAGSFSSNIDVGSLHFWATRRNEDASSALGPYQRRSTPSPLP